MEPSLYRITDPNYRSKIIKNKAVCKIRDSLIAMGIENIGMETNKIKKSKITGADVDDIYVPKLWSYLLLEFLNTTNLEGTCLGISQQEAEEKGEVMFEESLVDFDSKNFNTELATPSPTPSLSTVTSSKRKRNEDNELEDFCAQAKIFMASQTEDDNISKFTNFLNAEMRTIKNKSLLRKLKKQIHEVLYEIQEEDEKVQQ